MPDTMKDTPVKGILKRRQSARSDSPRRAVHFEAPPDLQGVLKRFIDNGQKDSDELEGLITHMRNQNGVSLIGWLQVLQNNITMLSPDLER